MQGSEFYKFAELLQQPVAFIEEYMQTLHPWQRSFINAVNEEKFMYLLGSRQIGKTYAIAAYVAQQLVSKEYQTIGYCSHSRVQTVGFIRLVHHIITTQIPFHDAALMVDNKDKIQLLNRSRLLAVSSPSSMRGITYSHIIFDDAAYIKDLMMNYHAVYPVIASSKQSKFIISTSAGSDKSGAKQIWDSLSPDEKIYVLYEDVFGATNMAGLTGLIGQGMFDTEYKNQWYSE